MEKTNKKNIIIGSFVLIVLILIWSIYKKKVKADELAQIKDAIDTGSGINQYDIDAILSRLSPDTTYLDAPNEAKRLKKAKGWLWDNDSEVFAVVQNKTKAQLKQISNELIKIEGLTLGQFVNDIFSDFADTGKIQTVYLTVFNAR